MKQSGGFTLLELLIVVGILAVLATVAIIILNPVEQYQEARDSNRFTDLRALEQTLSLLNFGDLAGPFGSPNTIYLSLPDDLSSQCSSWNLPAPPSGWSYACQPQTQYRQVNGSGWLPVDLTASPFGTNLAVLPTDEVNNENNYYYYIYESTTRTYELGTALEAPKNQPLAQNDGGDNEAFWELGSNLGLYPGSGSLAVVNESGEAVKDENNLFLYAQAASVGQVAFFIGTNQITGDNYLFWDNLTKRLGIGTAIPGQKLTVAGTIESTGFKLTSAPAAGSVLTSDAAGVGTWQAVPVAGGTSFTTGTNSLVLSGVTAVGQSTSQTVNLGFQPRMILAVLNIQNLCSADAAHKAYGASGSSEVSVNTAWWVSGTYKGWEIIITSGYFLNDYADGLAHYRNGSPPDGARVDIQNVTSTGFDFRLYVTEYFTGTCRSAKIDWTAIGS